MSRQSHFDSDEKSDVDISQGDINDIQLKSIDGDVSLLKKSNGKIINNYRNTLNINESDDTNNQEFLSTVPLDNTLNDRTTRSNMFDDRMSRVDSYGRDTNDSQNFSNNHKENNYSWNSSSIQNKPPNISPLNQMKIRNSNSNNNGNKNHCERTSSSFACIVTLTNTLLGVGIIGVPHAFAASGFVLGSVLFILFAILSSIGLHLLAVSAQTVGIYPSSFNTIASRALPGWAYIIDAAVAIKCFGVATSYLIVVGDNLPEVMREAFGYSDENQNSILVSRKFAVTLAFLMVTPLAFAKTLGALKYTATVAIGFVLFIVGLIISYAFDWIESCPPEIYPCKGKVSDILAF